jgi:glycosyltransferase involved in cell wall biosynthesis
MRALVVAPQPFFSPRGTPFSVYYRTLTATELGVGIDLLTYGEGRDVDLPGVTIHRLPRIRWLEPVPIGPSWQKAVLDVLLVMWTLRLLFRRRYDFVHAHEESVFYLRFLKPLFRFKLVYDMHSSLPQQLHNFGFTRSRVIVGAFRALEDTCLRNADAVITICPELESYALPRMPDPRRHFLIENSRFDDIRFAGVRPGAGTAGHAVEVPGDRPVVLYTGTFERYQGLELLLRGFALVRARRPDAFLLMVGGSPAQVQAYRSLALELGLDGDVGFTGQVDPAAAAACVRSASVLTSPRIEGTNTPLKIYQQLASGMPLVATRILSHTQVLSDDVCFLVDPEPASLADGVLAALEDAPRRESVVAAALALYRERYAPEAYRDKLRRMLGLLA